MALHAQHVNIGPGIVCARHMLCLICQLLTMPLTEEELLYHIWKQDGYDNMQPICTIYNMADLGTHVLV